MSNLTAREIVLDWFNKWERGDYMHLPIAEEFSHTSPFGTITGKQTYLELVQSNEDKFLGNQFEIHDGIYENEHACVRYTAAKGDFKLDVSEWFYLKSGLILSMHSYYHIGEIREERELDNG